MKKHFIGLCVGYFFINLIVYTFHGQVINILITETQITYSASFLLQLLNFLRFFGAFFWSAILDKYHIHKLTVVICILGYLLSFLVTTSLKYLITTRTALFYSALTLNHISGVFFNSGIYPALDSLCLNYLHNQEIPKSKYGIFKLFGAIGHTSTNFIGFLVGKIVGDKYFKENIGKMKLYYSFCYLPCCLLVFYFMIPKFSVPKLQNSKKRQSFKEIRDSLKKTSWLFYIFCISLMTLGFIRCSLSDPLTAYMRALDIKSSDQHLILFFRTSIELGVYFLGGFVEKFFNIDVLFLFALISGLIRSSIYTFVDISALDKEQRKIPFYISEIPKAFWSAFYGYSSARIARSFCLENNESLVSGIVYGCYNGISYVLFYGVAYICFLFENFGFQGSQFRGLFYIGLLVISFGTVLHGSWIISRRSVKNKG